MLKSLKIKNFKSITSATLELSPFTLIIGTNASGKSNALEVFQVLRWLMTPFNNQNDGALAMLYCRGSKENIWQDNSVPFNCTCFFNDNSKKESFEFSVSRERDSVLIPYCKYIKNNELINEFSKLSIEQFSIPLSVLNFFPGLTDELKEQLNSIAIKYSDYEVSKYSVVSRLTNVWILDVQPAKMRVYADKKYNILLPDGSNISSVLYNLCKKNENHKENSDIILDFIQDLPEQNVKKIDFIEVEERNEVMLKLKEFSCGRDKEFDATLLSDGTLRGLAIITFLLTAQHGQILIIEEIDNGIHPSRVKKFLKKIRDIAIKRNVQIIMTSHNPALLDAVHSESLKDVVCCYRDKDEGDSRFVRLGDLYLYPELIAQGSLGDLVTQGVVDRFVHDKRTEEEIIKQGIDWIDAFFDTSKGEK